MQHPVPLSTPNPKIYSASFIFLALMLIFPGSNTLAQTSISSWTELANMTLNGDYILTRNLTSSDSDYAAIAGPSANGGDGWEPIGTSSNAFRGDFDGGGYEIQDLTINRGNYVGLFGWVEDADIINVTLSDFDITGNSFVGSVAGYAARDEIATGSKFENLNASGVISAVSSVGGIVGYINFGYIQDSHTNVVINLRSSSSFSNAGGLAGWASNIMYIRFSSATMEITGSPGMRIGGLVGEWFRNSQNAFGIQNSFASVSIFGVRELGGLVGDSFNLRISDSYATGNISASGTPPIGNTSCGGLAGRSNTTIILNAYFAGDVNCDEARGALIGEANFTDVQSAYWNTDGDVPAGLAGEADSATDISDSGGLDTSEFYNADNFIGWNFGDSEVWILPDSPPFHFPILRNNEQDPPPGFDNPYDGGDGSPGNPFRIANAEQLDAVRLVPDGNFIVINDINLATYISPGNPGWNDGDGWEPIGDTDTGFSGTFDGDGYEISNLMIDRSFRSALFGVAEDGFEISNLTLSDVQISGSSRTASLIGDAENGTVTNVTATGSLNNVSGGTSGGLIGDARGVIINDSHADVTVSISGSRSFIGGLVGNLRIDSEVHRSSARGDVTNSGTGTGGLSGAAINGSVITESFATGNVTGQDQTGGLVGQLNNDAHISDSYAAGQVSVGPGFARCGGLVGRANIGSDITRSYALGDCDGGGALVGDTGSTNPVDMLHNYWNSDLTSNPGNNSGVVTLPDNGLTTFQMYQQASFDNWDFDDVWQFGADAPGVSFPTLRNNVQDPAPGFVESVFANTTSPFEIETADQLYAVRLHLGEDYILINDIDLNQAPYNSGSGWEPIGNLSTGFSGTFDGNGYEISNLMIDRAARSALFGVAEDGFEISNLTLSDVEISGSSRTASLIGDALNGTVTNVTATGSLNNVSGGSSGGLIGDAREIIINDSHTDVTVSVSGSRSFIGGLVGNLRIDSEIHRSSARGDVTNSGTGTGGLAGAAINGSVITESFATGNVTGQDQTGGLVGQLNNDAHISDSYATGHVEIGPGFGRCGGLVGRSNLGSDFTRSYALGDCDGGGSLVGDTGNNTPGEFLDTYWNSDLTSNPGNDSGAFTIPDNGLTTLQMYQQASFESWDFHDVWQLSADAPAASYPTLRNNAQAPAPGFVESVFANTASPYQIETADHLSAIRVYMDADYVIISDIDLGIAPYNQGDGWEPIPDFSGELDGGGFEIQNLTINGNRDRAGLFGFNSGTLRDFLIVDPDVSGAGSLATTEGVGAVAGVNTEDGNIFRVGVTTSDPDDNTVRISGSNASVGGITGSNNDGRIAQSFNTVSVSGGSVVGGLAGYISSASTVEDSYSLGNITGASNVGGIAGSSNGSVERLYVAAEVSGTGGGIGPFRGNDHFSGAEPSVNSFWNTDIGPPAGSRDANDTGLTGLTTPEMQTLFSFIDGDWDFIGLGSEEVWGFNHEENNGFPFLAWQENFTHNLRSGAQVLDLTVESGGTLNDSFDPEQFEYIATLSGDEITISFELAPGASANKTSPFTKTAVNGELTIELIVTAEDQSAQTTYEITSTRFAGGDGSEESPWIIENWFHLDNVRLERHDNFILANNLGPSTAGYTDLVADLEGDPVDNGWLHIGNSGSRFRGTFNGDGYTIDGLIIDRSGVSTGLFGHIRNAVIQDLHLTNAVVNGNVNSGTIAGLANSSSIIRVSVEMQNDIIAAGGGLIGRLEDNSEILDSYSTGSIEGSGALGGLVGWMFDSVISRSFSTASVQASENSGGIVGQMRDDSQIYDSYTTGDVTETFAGASRLGGFAGSMFENSQIQNSYSAGTHSNDNVRGFVGTMGGSSSISGSFWNEESTGTDTGASTGSTSGDVELTALTTSEMQDVFTFYDAGWDFLGEELNGTEDIWSWNPAMFDGYPFLSWQDDENNIVPLTVTALSPAVDAEDVPVDAEITATFSEDITLVEASNISMVDGESEVVPITVSVEENALIITPDGGDLEFDTEYTVTLLFHAVQNDTGLENRETQWSFTTTDIFSGGDGTEENPWLVETPEQLDAVREEPGAWYRQIADIDMEFFGDFEPIGFSEELSELDPAELEDLFTGQYDGDNHTISNLNIDRTGFHRVGLFAVLAEGSTVSDLNLTDITISAAEYAGGISGVTYGAITNASVSGTITVSEGHAGGIAGFFGDNGQISDSSADIVIAAGSKAGGLVGYASSCDTFTRNFARVDISGADQVGGIAGRLNCEASQNYAVGTLTAADDLGGLAGFAGSDAVILNSFFDGLLDFEGSSEDQFGAAVGRSANATLTNSYVSASLTGSEPRFYSGDLTIINSFWVTENEDVLNSVDQSRTILEMKDTDTFSGWDLSGIWSVDEGFTLPYLADTGPYRLFAYQTEGPRRWYMYSFPVQDARLKDLASFNLIQGITGGNDFYNDEFPDMDLDAQDPNFFAYQSSPAETWTLPDNFDYELEQGRGYIWFLFNNDFGPSVPHPFSMLLGGDVTDENVTQSLSSADWNLLGNPFGRELDLGELEFAGGNLTSNTVQYWDPVNATYEIRNISAGETVPAWRGFFVENNDADLVTFEDASARPYQNADQQIADNQTQSRSAGSRQVASSKNLSDMNTEAPLSLRFNLEVQEEETGDIYADRALSFVIHENAHSGWDIWDALKLSPVSDSFVYMAFEGNRDDDNVWQAQYSHGTELDDMIEIPVGLNSLNLEGSAALSIDGTDQFPPDWGFYLVDHQTGEWIDLKDPAGYEFYLEPGESSQKPKDTLTVPGTVLSYEKNADITRFTFVVSPTALNTEGEEDDLPEVFELSQNYPNPFNPTTIIPYALPEAAQVRIDVFNVLGQRVAVLVNEHQQAGRHQVQFDASRLGSGMYIYRIQAGSFHQTKTMMLVK